MKFALERLNIKVNKSCKKKLWQGVSAFSPVTCQLKLLGQRGGRKLRSINNAPQTAPVYFIYVLCVFRIIKFIKIEG